MNIPIVLKNTMHFEGEQFRPTLYKIAVQCNKLIMYIFEIIS